MAFFQHIVTHGSEIIAAFTPFVSKKLFVTDGMQAAILEQQFFFVTDAV